MRRFYFISFASVLLFLMLLFVFAGPVSTSVAYSSDDSGSAVLKSCKAGNCPSYDLSGNNTYCVYFFYGETCPHCAYIYPKIQEFAEQYPNFSFYELEIYYNETNQNLFQDFIARYGIEKPGVPAVFIGDRALIGSNMIEKELKESLAYFSENEPVCPLRYNKEEATSHEISPVKDIKLTLPAVIIAAIADSINPCAFAVLIFLLLYITTFGASRRVLRVGIAYIIAVFAVYFLAGLGLLTAVQSIGMTRIVFQIAAIFSIVAGTINIKDFFWYGKGITLAIPESRKSVIEKYVQKASLPAAIILGILVSMFELPCTGGIYLAILSLIAKNAYSMAVPYLLFYNLIFVLPLVIILFAVYFGMSANHAERFRLERRKLLRLIIGVVMIALGISMLLGVFG